MVPFECPGPLFMILGAYLYFCLYAGPRYMRDRKPFELKNTLLVYNAVQVLSAGCSSTRDTRAAGVATTTSSASR